jgi:hypothetical protein
VGEGLVILFCECPLTCRYSTGLIVSRQKVLKFGGLTAQCGQGTFGKVTLHSLMVLCSFSLSICGCDLTSDYRNQPPLRPSHLPSTMQLIRPHKIKSLTPFHFSTSKPCRTPSQVLEMSPPWQICLPMDPLWQNPTKPTQQKQKQGNSNVATTTHTH